MAENSTSVTGNSFLDTLSRSSRERLDPLLARAKLKKGTVLAEPGSGYEAVAFPIDGLVSTLTEMCDGVGVEVGLTGHDGLAGGALVLGSRISAHRLIVQVSGSFCTVPADAFLRVFNADMDFRERVLAYCGYSFAAATQFVACNRLHLVEERYARWILMATDRVGRSEYPLTQEFISQMLGTRRASVTIVASMLSKAGLISYRRGYMSVLDRSGLEDAACECYDAANESLRRYMGYGARQIALDGLTSEAEAVE